MVTEHGLVPVSWHRDDDGRSVSFDFQIPSGVKAHVSIPRVCEKPTLILNGVALVTKGEVRGEVALGDRFVAIEIGCGECSGEIMP